jgi:hypothetical protein
MQLSPAAQDIVNFWTTTRTIPFKRELIHRNKDGSCSMCAQGQVLYRNGYSEAELFGMCLSTADKETARILEISITHSILLRRINDIEEGSPQEVLSNPEKYLGPNWVKVLDFWVYLDILSEDQLKVVTQRYLDLSGEERSVAKNIAYTSAKATTEYAEYAGSSVTLYMLFCGYNRAYAAADYATLELIGNVENPVFVPLFYGL